MSNSLRVFRAGAGSGKTTALCKHIADRVVQGLDPTRILATTFTVKAASELRGRIHAGLLASKDLTPRERIAKAERLELAPIGTVHGVGFQLLGRYALQMGLSPDLKVLDETGCLRVLEDLLNQTARGRWSEMAALCRRLSLGRPQDLALELLNQKRANRIENALG